MENESIKELLFDYFAGDLSEKQEEQLIHWLKSDDTHKEILSEMADWWAIAHVPQFSSEMQGNFNEQFASLLKKDSFKKKTHYLSLFKLSKTAIFLLLATLSGYLFFYADKIYNNETVAGIEHSIQSEIQTPMRGVTRVLLPDSSEVWVNSGSLLKYNYKKSTREISLVGEAYFEVKQDLGKPFIVKSEALDIKVTGTSFNVHAYEDDEVIDISLISGQVNISLSTKDANNVVLTPNKQLSYNKQTSQVEINTVNSIDAIAWINGCIKFSSKTFQVLAKELERRFNIQIRIESQALKKEVFSGSFLSGHNLQQILNEMDVDKKYVWSQDGDILTIRDKIQITSPK